MIETKQCGLCLNAPPYTECCASDDELGACAQLALYRAAKLPKQPIIYTHVIEGEVVPRADYDELRRYASRLATDLLLLNGIITRAARDAQKYVDAAERSIDHG